MLIVRISLCFLSIITLAFTIYLFPHAVDTFHYVFDLSPMDMMLINPLYLCIGTLYYTCLRRNTSGLSPSFLPW